jgi:hypothetical protein
MHCSHFSVLSPLFLIPYFFLRPVVNVCVCVCVFVCGLLSYLFVFVPDHSLYIFHPPFVHTFFCLLVSICVPVSMVFFSDLCLCLPFLTLSFLPPVRSPNCTVEQAVLKTCGLFSTSGRYKASTSIQATTAAFYVFAVYVL